MSINISVHDAPFVPVIFPIALPAKVPRALPTIPPIVGENKEMTPPTAPPMALPTYVSQLESCHCPLIAEVTTSPINVPTTPTAVPIIAAIPRAAKKDNRNSPVGSTFITGLFPQYA